VSIPPGLIPYTVDVNGKELHGIVVICVVVTCPGAGLGTPFTTVSVPAGDGPYIVEVYGASDHGKVVICVIVTCGGAALG
jgi:hypothetical protein